LNVIDPWSQTMNFCDYELAEEWKLKNATYAANAIEMGA
jgi:hypothetical protein